MIKSIGMLLDGFYPSDIRVQKEATALINGGFEVSLLCKRRKGEKRFEVVDGINLMRINAGTTHTQKGVLDVLLAINFIHPIFKNKLPSFIKNFSIDILHVHDLPLVKTAVIKSKKHGIKVIADFHENYPDALNIWFEWKKNPLIRFKNKIFFGYARWSRYEEWAVNNADKIIAVVDEMKQRLISAYNIEDDKAVVVTNTESKTFIDNELDTEIYGQDKDKFIIAYTGGVGPHRGVDTAIEAMSRLTQYEDMILYITGTSSRAASQIMGKYIKKHKLENQVRVLGHRPFSQFYSFMKMATVNIIPHHSNGHTDNTIPHKLFQCMMTGNPLLVSSSAPLKRVVDSTQSGLVFEAGNAEDLAGKIIELYGSREKRNLLGDNGLTSSLDGEFNWEFTSKILVAFYKSL